MDPLSAFNSYFTTQPDLDLHELQVISEECSYTPLPTDEVIIEIPNKKSKNTNVSSCLQIGKRVLEAFPLEEQVTIGDIAEGESNADGDDDFDEGFDPDRFFEFFTDEIAHPSPHQAIKRAFKILSAAEELEPPSWSKEFIITPQVWDDLNLLFGNREHPTTCLGNILTKNHSHSEIGKAFLYGMLARPIADHTLLERRQDIIKELVENEDLFQELDSLLAIFGKHETMFSGLWGKEQLMQFIKKEEYFTASTQSKNWPRVAKILNAINNQLNRSSLALDVKTSLDKVSGAYSLVMSTISPFALGAFGLTSLSYVIPSPSIVHSFTDNWMQSNLFFPSMTLIFALPYLLKNRTSQGICATGAAYAGITGIQRTWKQFLVSFRYDDFLRKRLASIAECIKSMEKLGKAMPEEMKGKLTFFKYFTHLFDELCTTNADLSNLIEELHTPTFDLPNEGDNSTTILFRRGKVLSTYRLLDRLKTSFEATIAAVGELDAFLSIAKLIKASQHSPASYCFPKFISGAKDPSIQLQNFWNPFLDSQIAVKNSVNIGRIWNSPHMVVTGPNSGGKSTIVCKGIPIAVLMAQSLGIAPADSMTLAIFKHLAVYMNISDSIIDKESRFQREGKQAFAHGEHIEILSQSRSFSLAVFDEIFSGTSPEEGALWGYRTAKGFSQYSNCVAIVATHFSKLTELEADTNGLFVNYRVSVQEDENGCFVKNQDGKLKRTYTLEKGISHQHIAKEVLYEQGERSAFFIRHFLNSPN